MNPQRQKYRFANRPGRAWPLVPCLMMAVVQALGQYADIHPDAASKRFVRGTGADPTFHSFVIPLDGQEGIALEPMGGNEGTFTPDLFPDGAPWFLRTESDHREHLDIENYPFGIVFRHPIVAFGAAGGGTPLYPLRPYSFGAYSGSCLPNGRNATLIIRAFNRADFMGGASDIQPVHVSHIELPNPARPREWQQFASNGFQMVVHDTPVGLRTQVRVADGRDLPDAWGVRQGLPYIFTHTATSDDFVYMVDMKGWYRSGAYDLTLAESFWDGASPEDASRLYSLDFEQLPAWRSTFIDEPHFDGQPLPPGYLGASPEELFNAQRSVTNPVPLAPSSVMNLDNSTELRRHPSLDQFVQDMGNDPIALASYVQDEIQLTDALAYNDDGSVSEKSINDGGVKRGALAVFQEEQGSPKEQCGLLVYLLRRVGVPAAYVFGPEHGIKIPDTVMSRVLRMQLRGAVDYLGQRYDTNSLISVDYPWVTAYITNYNGSGSSRWVHLFPWLKDTEIQEGRNPYEFLPEEYDSGWKWLRRYLCADTNLLSLSRDNNSPLYLFPKHVAQRLAASGSGLTPDSLGVRYRDRRHQRSRWDQFACPFWVTNSALTFRANLNEIPRVFDTVRFHVSASTNGIVIGATATNEWRIADLHNRRFLLYQNKPGTAYQAHLVLAPFRPGTSGDGNFSTADFAGLLRRQVVHMNLGAGGSNLLLNIGIEHLGHRAYTNTVTDTDLVYLRVEETRQFKTSAKIALGDLAAICLNTGRATRRMLATHAVDFWNEQRRIEDTGGSTTTEAFQGTLAYLMGMGYNEKVGRSLELHQRLHKARLVSLSGDGLAKLESKRLSNGMPEILPGGEVHLIQPAVDMFYHHLVWAASGVLHSDAGMDVSTTWENFTLMANADASAQEHAVINDFFRESAAISTVRLLQLAGETKMTNASLRGVIELDRSNVTREGNTAYQGKKLCEWDPPMWSKITNAFAAAFSSNYVSVFITPGPMTAPSESTNAPPYRGMGAMVLDPKRGAWHAIISANMNGGSGSSLPDRSWSISEFNRTLLLQNDSGYCWAHAGDVTGNLAPVSATWTLDTTSSSLANILTDGEAFDFFSLDPCQTTASELANSMANYSGPDVLRHGNTIQIDAGLPDTATSFNRMSRGSLATLVMDPVSVLSGEFYIDDVDLMLPGPMPLEMRRNYSSHNLARNQLGYGWKLNYMPYLSLDSTGDVIYGADPDGSTIAYRRDAVTSNLFLPNPQDNPEMVNVSYGQIGSMANPMQGHIERSVASGKTNYVLRAPDGSRRIFCLRSFPVGSGTKKLYRTRPYLERWEDSRSNMLWFSYGTNSLAPDYGQVRRIQSSGGQALGLIYDVFGRVTEAYTVDGRRVSYEYDRYGDLARVSRPDGSTLNYEYQHTTFAVSNRNEPYSEHLIVREVKPDGRVLLNAYDGQRRVTNQCATVGADINPVRNATFIYSNDFVLTNQRPVSGHTIVRDAYDRDSVYRYAAGMVTNIQDPLNQHICREWYDGDTNQPSGGYPRSLKREIDKRGLITDYSYDTRGNITNLTITGDLTGDGGPPESRTIVTSYDANNLPVGSMELNSSRSSQIIYGTCKLAYLAQRIEQYAGAKLVGVVTNGYSDIVAASNLCARGMRTFTRSWAPDIGIPSETAVGYDARGYPTAQTNFTGTSDPPIVKLFRFNARGEMATQTDAADRTTSFEYDPMGRPTWTQYREGGAIKGWTGTYYNLNGEAEWIDGPRYGPEDYIWRKYDGAGRPLEEIRWLSRARSDGTGVEAPSGDALYATKFYKHDRFGNLTNVIDARGNLTAMTYDDIGQMTARRRYHGRTTEMELSAEFFSYEPGGKVFTHVNPLGGVTTNLYTSTGQLRRSDSPDGTTQQWRYYSDGRLQKEILPNGSYWETTYNDAEHTVTRTLKSSAGNTERTETRVFDERGNILSDTVAGGSDSFETKRVVDGLNRPKTETGPVASGSSVQQTTTWQYDASGKVTKVLNGLGHETETVTDIMGRPISISIKDGASVIRHTSYAYSADHHSVTITEGTGANAVSHTVWTDTAANAILTVNGDGSYRRSVVDPGGLVLSVRDEIGNESSFSHDGLGRLIARMLPGRAAETLAYDATGNLTNRTMPGGLAHIMTYDAASRLTSEILRNGCNTTRSFNYVYHPCGDGIGLLASVYDPRGITINHSYDAFRRANETTTSGPGPGQDITTSRSYDCRGLATNIAQASNAPDHPVTAVSRSFDGYGQIASETIILGCERFSSFSQSWDAAGHRIALTPSGFGVGAPAYAFGYRADGLMGSVAAGDRTYAFGFADNGLLNSRSGNFSVTSITSCDARGRTMGRTISGGGAARLTETLGWNDDGTLRIYGATRAGAAVPSEGRTYGYDVRQRLSSESLSTSQGMNALNEFEFDGGRANGIGMRTLWQLDGVDQCRSTMVDALGRVNKEESFAATRMIDAVGNARGAASLSLDLDDRPVMPVIYPGWADSNGAWSASLRVEPGDHVLKAVARHPSGSVCAVTNSAFAVLGTNQTIDVAYDAVGNVIRREFADGRTQSLAWDALGRMTSVIETNGAGDGYRWSAVYDALGRRLRTVHTPLHGGAPLDDDAQRVDAFFDPEVEFLEIGASVSGPNSATRIEWKVYGPDLNGTYGGLQGTGGLEAIVDQDTGNTVGVINDFFGNCVGWIAMPGGAPIWNPCRTTGYGLAPGSYQKPFGSTVGLAEATVWRSRRIDPTGLFWLGARYYEPHGGRFLSPDPLGHSASWSLYDYAAGDPINAMDPDGRVGKGFGSGAMLGDYYKPQNFAQGIGQFMGQVGMGFTPVGWAGDVRDFTAALGELKSSGLGLGTGAGVALAGIAFVPGLGDTVKGILKPLFGNTDTATRAARNFDNGPAYSELELATLRNADARKTITGVGNEAFHYTLGKWGNAIKQEGLRPGTYATQAGELGPLQAKLELALPPTRPAPEIKVRIDLDGLRKAGYDIPAPTRVSSTVVGPDGRVYQMPGGGYEMLFPYEIPGDFLDIIPLNP